MPGEIKNNFRILLAQKATIEKKNIPLNKVKEETGIAWSTLQSWANNEVTRYDEDVIIKLLDYFECELSDLIVYARD